MNTFQKMLFAVSSKWAQSVAMSLDDQPDNWDWTNEYNSFAKQPYKIWNDVQKIEIWIANNACGIHVDVAGRRVIQDCTTLSTFGLSIDHWTLWFAYNRWKKRNPWRKKVYQIELYVELAE